MRKDQLILLLLALTASVAASKTTPYRKRESLRGRQNLLVRRTLDNSFEKEPSPDAKGKISLSSDDYYEVTEIKDSSDTAPKGGETSKSKSSSGGRGVTEFSQSKSSSGSRKRTKKSKKTMDASLDIPKDISYYQEMISGGAGSNKGHGSKLKGSWNKSSSAKHKSGGGGSGSGAKKSGSGGGKKSLEKKVKKARSEPQQAKQTKLTHKPSDAESWDEEDMPPSSYDESLPPPAMDPESQDDQPATETTAPTQAVACTLELFICPDGTSVGRTGPNCEFEPCPTGDQMTEAPTEPLVPCTQEAKICPDGSFVGREGPDCDFAPCPTAATTAEPMTEAPTEPFVACTEEAKICPDGSFVGREGPDCEFAPCPSEASTEVPTTEVSMTEIPRTEAPTSPAACTVELFICPDGSFVGRTGPDCEFEPCPTTVAPSEIIDTSAPSSEGSDGAVACPLDVLECPDGTFVGRIGPDCEFEQCPATTTIVPTADEASIETSAPTVMVSEATFGTSDGGDGLLQIENGVCQGAIELKVGDSVTGTTAAASDEDEVEACDAGVGSLFPEVEDGLISLQQFGVWYSIESTDTRLRASVCSETANQLAPIIVTIYAGGDGCLNLSCAPVYNTAGCSVEWAASSNFEMYYILVQSLVAEGTPLDIDNDLVFELTITEAIISANDFCEGAIELEPGDTIPGLALSASAASGEDISVPCSLELQPPSSNVLIPGVWYSVAGTGGRLVASTCNESTEQGPILVTIYSGSCGDLQCETNTVADAPCAAEIASTVEGQTYYILVEKVLRGADVGIFELTVSG